MLWGKIWNLAKTLWKLLLCKAAKILGIHVYELTLTNNYDIFKIEEKLEKNTSRNKKRVKKMYVCIDALEIDPKMDAVIKGTIQKILIIIITKERSRFSLFVEWNQVKWME